MTQATIERAADERDEGDKAHGRAPRTRHYLMCRPTYYDVAYTINPWMDPRTPTSTARAVAQWTWLRDVFVALGHTVDLLEPVPGLPDMVFTANGAIVIDQTVLVARFRHRQRAEESQSFLTWFRSRGYSDVRQVGHVNEGQGDFLVTGGRILAGSGFRTDPRAHKEVRRRFGLPVTSLTLIDPRYYHLDTALGVLDDDQIMYYPQAFSPSSVATLRALYPDAVIAGDADAAEFGLNAVSDGLHVVLSKRAVRLAAQLRERGFEPIGADLSELLKAGGGVKCCTLELWTETSRRDRNMASLSAVLAA